MKFFPMAPSPVLMVLLVLTPVQGVLRAQESSSPNSAPGAASKTSENPKYGDDTPEATIRSFYVALAMADRDTVEYLLVTPKEL